MPPQPQPSSGIKWNEVTWYSKLGAMILFLGVVPALCFYIGIQYQLTQQNILESNSTTGTIHSYTYGDPDGFFTLHVPAAWKAISQVGMVGGTYYPIPVREEVIQILSSDGSMVIQINVDEGNSCVRGNYETNFSLGGLLASHSKDDSFHTDAWALYTNDAYYSIGIQEAVYNGPEKQPTTNVPVSQSSIIDDQKIAEDVVNTIYFLHSHAVTPKSCQ
jgi:hypothetical protein